MLPTILAAASVVCGLLFAVLSVTALVMRDSLGDTAGSLVWFGAVPLLAISLLLAVALLIYSAFTTSD